MTPLRFRSDESGAAMLTALLAVVILSGMALVFMNRANTETRASANSRDHEAAIHVSEAASDRQVAATNADDDHVTTDRTGQRIEVSPSSLTDEEAWAQSLLGVMRPDAATGVASDAWTALDGGESFAVRPWDLDEDAPLDVIYSVGAVPSFDAPNAKIRVIKIQIAQDNFIPEYALLTGATLKFGGNAEIIEPGCDPSAPEEVRLLNCTADVHTNGEFDNPGNASKVHGRVSVTQGSCPGNLAQLANGCVDASHGVQEKPIPEFNAREFYNRGDDVNPDPDGEPVEWYDLCPPGKPVAGQPTIRRPGVEPCLASSAQVWPSDEDDGTLSMGWTWEGNHNRWVANSLKPGIFYVYHADARVLGTEPGSGQRAVSILVEQDPNNRTKSGSLRVRGNPQMQSALESVLFITDADLSMFGTGSGGTCGETPSGYSGFIGIGEQLDVSGNIQVRGAIIVRDLDDVHPLARRHNASVQGTMCLEYDDSLDIDFTGRWVITFWNELQ